MHRTAVTDKEQERKKIAAAIRKFKRAGGKIERVGYVKKDVFLESIKHGLWGGYEKK